MSSITLYTPKYRDVKKCLNSEHYAKNALSYPICTLFCLTKRQKKGILYWYVAEIMETLIRKVVTDLYFSMEICRKFAQNDQ